MLTTFVIIDLGSEFAGGRPFRSTHREATRLRAVAAFYALLPIFCQITTQV